MTERRLKARPVSDKAKVPDFRRKGEKSYAEVAKIYSKNKSPIREIVKKEKETHAGFATASQNVKVTVTVRDKGLVMMKKASNLYNKIF